MCKKGFTLIEPLVIVGIIGVLVTIIFASFKTLDKDFKLDCSIYKLSPLSNVPAGCVKEFTGGMQIIQTIK